MESKYVVCIFSQMDGDNRTFLIEANSQTEAAKKAIIAHCPPKYRDNNYIDWANGLGESFSEVAIGAAQSELVLSEPFKIDTLVTLSNANR